jgi:hypothetical protein
MTEVDYKKDLFIITHQEMEELKTNALKLVDVLPDEPMEALIVIAFLKEHMEATIGRKCEQIKIVMKK